jgi:RHS repeat-associated protein
LRRIVGGSRPALRGYAWDAFDRLRWRSSWAGGETFNYDPTSFRLTSVQSPSGTRSYGHDARGNLTSRPGFTHTFDAINRLTRSQAPGGNPERYHYDGHGRRTATFRANGSIAVDYYTRDGVLRGRAETALNRSIAYIHLGGTLVAQDAGQRRSSFGRTYFHTDHLGTPIAKTNEAGIVTERDRRQSFGQPLVGPLKDGPGYTGHMEDPGTGLVYMQQRYYDPAIARFLSVDPVGPLADPSNHFGRYHYANNNPYRFTDPDGRKSEVKDGRIHITPEDRTVPTPGPIPNTVGAQGVSPSDRHFHTYGVQTNSNLNAKQAAEGFKNNPTPGNDRPASSNGTVNNVGPIPTAGDNNYVRSFVVDSPDPAKFTDITINYTISGAHGLQEGFVMRYGEISDSGTVLRGYAEGNNWRQNPALENLRGYGWGPQVQQVWTQNHNEIIRDAPKP